MSNLIFCYGSNMCVERLSARIGDTELIGLARLPRFVFRMHKRGYDGSAKADARWTGKSTDAMWGVVRRVPGLSKSELDRCEGVGVGYDCTTATAELVDGTTKTVGAHFPDEVFACGVSGNGDTFECGSVRWVRQKA